jgi:outer membrane protein assembly factor BamB
MSTLSPVAKTFDWMRAPDLTFSPSMPLTPLGSSLLMLSYVSRPGVLPDGTLVVALKGNGDIVALDTAATTGNKDHTTWRVHPGGVITSCITLGEITVATTSERRVVAYGPTGLALWSAPLTDTSNARPVEFGGRIVVVTVDGAVVALDPATGAEAWRSSLPNEIQLRPQVSGDTLVAIDESGTMVAFDTSGNHVWQSSELSTDLFTISAGVIVMRERGGSAVRGYDLATGTKLWRVWQSSSVSGLVDVDGIAVAYGLGGVTSFDPATGAVRWTEANAPVDAVVSGDHLVVLTTTDLVVVARDGTRSAQWRHDLTNFSTTTAYLVVGPDSVSAVTTTQLYRGVLA